MKNKKLFYGIITGSLLIGIMVGGIYFVLLSPNIFAQSRLKGYLYIPKNCNFEELDLLLSEKVNWKSKRSFMLASQLLQFKTVRSGRYQINSEMNNYTLVKRLKNKEQTPLNVVFPVVRTKEQLSGRISKQLMLDSTEMIRLLNDERFLDTFQLNPLTLMAYFIPNTYQLYWDINVEQLVKRMLREYTVFWNKERSAKAESIHLSPLEVSILASIIEEESQIKEERPIIAGLYLNRLHRGMLLQADPTIKFALKDFELRRILDGHLEYDSPYNTYLYAGLPPGPICTPSINAIDAVLNYQPHDYLYMCAKETFNGEHNFAATWAEHIENARKYRDALNENQIFK